MSSYERENVRIVGTILGYRLQAAGKGRFARLVMRTLVVDRETGIAIDGALEEGESIGVSDRTPGSKLILQAAEQAAELTSLMLRRPPYSEALILATTDYAASVDRGPEDGYKPQTSVVLMHAGHAIARGTVASSRAGRAEIMFEGSIVGLTPGDAAQVVDIPSRPPFGSGFPDYSSGSFGRPHRLHWILP